VPILHAGKISPTTGKSTSRRTPLLPCLAATVDRENKKENQSIGEDGGHQADLICVKPGAMPHWRALRPSSLTEGKAVLQMRLAQLEGDDDLPRKAGRRLELLPKSIYKVGALPQHLLGSIATEECLGPGRGRRG
jgi:hypothetical protein